MDGNSGADRDGSAGGQFGLDELRSQALRCLTLTLAGLAWASNFLLPGLTGDADKTEQFFLASLCLVAIAGCGAIVSRFSVTLAGTLVAASTTALIGFAGAHQDDPAVLGLLGLVVVAVVAVSGPRHGFAWAIRPFPFSGPKRHLYHSPWHDGRARRGHDDTAIPAV